MNRSIPLMFWLAFGSLAAQDAQGVRELLAASSSGHTAQVADLLASGVDVNGRGPGERTALHSAAAAGNLRTARLLLASGADVNLRDARGRTALMEAAAFGYPALTRLLIGLGADPAVADAGGRTALDLARLAGNTDVQAVLEAASAADPAAGQGDPPKSPAQP